MPNNNILIIQMTPQEKTIFINDFQKLSKATQAIVCVIAISFKTIADSDFNRISSYAVDLTISKKNILKELDSFIVHIQQITINKEKHYSMPWDKSLFLFIHLAKENKIEFFQTVLRKAYIISWLEFDEYQKFTGALSYFLLKSGEPIYFTSELTSSYHLLILKKALMMEEFEGLAQSLPFPIRLNIFKFAIRQYIERGTMPSEADSLYQLFMNINNQTNDEKEYYNDIYSIRNLLIPGKLNEIPEQVSANTPAGLYLQALYHQQVRKDISLAIKLYEKGIKMDKEETTDVLTSYSIFNYTYATALCQDDTPASIKKINTYLKKRVLAEDIDYYTAYLMFLLKVNADTYKLRESLSTSAPLFCVNKTTHLLACCIIKLYRIADEKILNTLGIAKSTPPSSGFDWLDMEVQSVFNNKDQTFKLLQAKLGFQSLAVQNAQEEEWERALNLLINTYTPATGKKAPVTVSKSSRVAYLVSMESEYIQPVLQTSTDGTHWSIGRNIALQRFQSGSIPELTEVDLRVSKTISAVRGYYGKVDYSLSFTAAIPLLVGHPYVFLYTNPTVPLQITESAPELTITKDKHKFYLNTNTSDITKTVQIISETDTCYKVLRLDAKQKEIIAVLSKMPVLPIQAQDKLLKLISVINQTITVHSDLIDTNSESLTKTTADSRIIVQLLPIGNSLKVDLYIKPFTTQPPYCRAGTGAKSILATIDGIKSQAVRSMNKELANRNSISNELQQITDTEDDNPDSFVFEKPEQTLEMLERLADFTEIASIEWPEGVKFKVSKPVNFSSLFCGIKMKNSWLEVSGELKVDEELVVSIQTLLSALKNNNTGRFVELNPGEYIALTEQLRKQLANLEAVGTIDKKGNLQLPQFSAPILTDLTDLGAIIKGDSKYKSLLKNIKDVQAKEYTIPKQLKAELRDYQSDGFRWMARLADWGAGACLADDMGLGKTIQAIAILLHKATKGASLVICPASVLLNWKREIERFAPSLRVLVLNEATDRKSMVTEADKYDVVLVTFGLLVTEEALLVGKTWSVTAIDEAHTIKNKETKSSKVAMQLQSDFRLLLTGTPIQNHLGELWNLFLFITPGLLGSFEHFTDYFINPITQDKDKNKQKRLKQLISPFLLRRTKQAVLDELPSKTEIVQEVDLSEEEKAYYEALRREAQLQSLQTTAGDRLKVLAEITKLRMAACNINLVSKELPFNSSKTEAFMQIVQGVTESSHRALVFSQFTTELALLKNALDAEGIDYLYLDGSVSIPNREKLVKEFQTGTTPLFLISLKAGGLGLNLTAADFVIHMDPWWNPAIEDQASDRVHRIGQTQPVTIYRLIARNTIEEKILKLHATKKDLSDSLLEGSDLSSQLTREDLLELLKE